MSAKVNVDGGVNRKMTEKLLKIDGQNLKLLVEASTTWLKTNQQIVNELNVFPVPDGDTGTNMLLTMQAAYNEIASWDEGGVGKMAHGIAQGALMGARGNSGVILSQLWRGFARQLDNLDTMDAALFVRALAEARNTAYKGVVRPVEGTILTVAKDVAAAAETALQQTDDLTVILEKIVAAADVSVQHTPELLPILKQAGVVDSGGKGLFYILEGMLRHIQNQPLELAHVAIQPISIISTENTLESIEPGQDFEWVLDFRPHKPIDIDSFYQDLTEIGTSIQLGEGDGMYRMHIHVPTAKFYAPIKYIETLGTLTRGSVENLMDQMEINNKTKQKKIELKPVEPGEIAVIAVSPGAGLSLIFASLEVAAIIEGGQSMNPSTEEILQAVDKLPTENIIILPNNKNIILAAQNALNMTKKNVIVIPSVSIPQGFNAMLHYDRFGNLETVAEHMRKALGDVDTGEITTATRSVQINSVDVHEGEVIALLNGKLVGSTTSVESACMDLLEKATTEDKERITFFSGANISKSETDRIVAQVRLKYPKHEIEEHEGGQPYYQFILAIE